MCFTFLSLSVHSFVFLTEDDETAEALQTVFLSGCQGKPNPAKGSAAQALLFISFIPADERHSLISLIVQGFFFVSFYVQHQRTPSRLLLLYRVFVIS